MPGGGTMVVREHQWCCLHPWPTARQATILSAGVMLPRAHPGGMLPAGGRPWAWAAASPSLHACANARCAAPPLPLNIGVRLVQLWQARPLLSTGVRGAALGRVRAQDAREGGQKHAPGVGWAGHGPEWCGSRIRSPTIMWSLDLGS